MLSQFSFEDQYPASKVIRHKTSVPDEETLQKEIEEVGRTVDEKIIISSDDRYITPFSL